MNDEPAKKCCVCIHWQGKRTSYLGDCALAGRRTQFDETCEHHRWCYRDRAATVLAEMAQSAGAAAEALARFKAGQP